MRLAYVLDDKGCLQPQLVRGPRPGALVVDRDAFVRLDSREDLEADGYEVATCPGPSVTHCRWARDPTSSGRCPRMPAEAALIVLDATAAATALPQAYRAWFPLAEIRTRGS